MGRQEASVSPRGRKQPSKRPSATAFNQPSTISSAYPGSASLQVGGPLMNLSGSLASRSVKRSRSSDGGTGTRLSYVAQQQLVHRTTLTSASVLTHVQTLSSQGQHFAAYVYFLEHLELFCDPNELETILNKLLANSRAHWLAVSPHLGNQSNLSTPVQVSFEGGHLITSYGTVYSPSPTEISSARTPVESVDDSPSSLATAPSSTTGSTPSSHPIGASHYTRAAGSFDSSTTPESEAKLSRVIPAPRLPPASVPALQLQKPFNFTSTTTALTSRSSVSQPDTSSSDTLRSSIDTSPSTAGTSATSPSEPNTPKSATFQDQPHPSVPTPASQHLDSSAFSHTPSHMATSQTNYGPSLYHYSTAQTAAPLHAQFHPLYSNYSDGESPRDVHGQHSHSSQALSQQNHALMSVHHLDGPHEVHGSFNSFYGFTNAGLDTSLMPLMSSPQPNTVPSGSSPTSSACLPIASQDNFRHSMASSHTLSSSPSHTGSPPSYADMDMLSFGTSHTESEEYFHWSPHVDS